MEHLAFFMFSDYNLFFLMFSRDIRICAFTSAAAN